jgi:hypothetical protein
METILMKKLIQFFRDLFTIDEGWQDYKTETFHFGKEP